MPDIPLSPFLGIDTQSPEPVTSTGQLKDAVNVDIDRDGQLRRRDGLAAITSAAASSTWWSRTLEQLLVVASGSLSTVSLSDGSLTSLGQVRDDEVDFVEVNNELLVIGLNTLSILRDGALQGLGVEQPPPPLMDPSAQGGVPAGRYGVCMTFIADNGEESAASDAVFLDVLEGGSLYVSALPVPLEAKVRSAALYCTTANGDAFYLNAVVPLPSAGFHLQPWRPGRLCDTRHMQRMRGGMYARYWRGRLVVARGNTLYLSEPMRYGLSDTRHGFIQFPQGITLLQPVEAGLFVGQRDGVVFLRGTSPGDLTLVQTGAGRPLPGSSTEIDGEEMSGDFARGAQKYAVWFGERGYTVGGPDGGVVEPQSKQFRTGIGQRGRTVVHNRRLTTLVT